MQKNKRASILSTLFVFLCLTNCSSHANKPEVDHFIDHMVQTYHFDRQQLQQLFRSIKPNQAIIRSFKAPKERLTWSNYKSIFVTSQRAKLGAQFLKQHANVFTKAEKQYGVPASIIAAILGIETRYGSVPGNYRVIDSLSTLSFNNNRRAHYFEEELAQYLLLSRENPAIHLSSTKGSYAGALGKAQFMPSSYRKLAVDATHKGYSDLINNSEDAILSIANYLKFYGWKKGAPIAVKATISPQALHALPNINASYSLKQLSKYRIFSTKHLDPQLKARLIILPLTRGNEYWLGFNNFQVIKSYNTSVLYGMAVYQLSNLIHYYVHAQK